MLEVAIKTVRDLHRAIVRTLTALEQWQLACLREYGAAPRPTEGARRFGAVPPVSPVSAIDLVGYMLLPPLTEILAASHAIATTCPSSFRAFTTNRRETNSVEWHGKRYASWHNAAAAYIIESCNDFLLCAKLAHDLVRKNGNFVAKEVTYVYGVEYDSERMAWRSRTNERSWPGIETQEFAQFLPWILAEFDRNESEILLHWNIRLKWHSRFIKVRNIEEAIERCKDLKRMFSEESEIEFVGVLNPDEMVRRVTVIDTPTSAAPTTLVRESGSLAEGRAIGATDNIQGQPGGVIDLNSSPSRANQSATHSDDFHSVIWFGTRYDFNATQSQVVRVLWENWEKGTPDVGKERLLEAIDPESRRDRVDTVFRGNPAWKTMIVPASRKGNYRLNEPKNDG